MLDAFLNLKIFFKAAYKSKIKLVKQYILSFVLLYDELAYLASNGLILVTLPLHSPSQSGFQSPNYAHRKFPVDSY